MAKQAPYPCDVFISYSQADSAWVHRELLPRLQERVQVRHSGEFWDAGSKWAAEIEQAIACSEHVIAVFSSAYLADPRAQFEASLAQTIGLKRGTWPLLPVLIEQVTLPPRFAMVASLDLSSPDSVQTDLPRLIRQLVKPSISQEERAERAEPTLAPSHASGSVPDQAQTMEPRGGFLDLIRRLFGEKLR